MFGAADIITTVNHRHARTITELFAPRVAPAVIRDACDPMDLAPPPSVDLEGMGVRSGTTVIAFLGQLIHGRLDDLLRAMERLPSSLPVQALIIGNGPDRPGYERRVAESDRLRGRVIFAGFQERRVGLAMVAVSAIAFSDCWSAAGFPFKLFEYMALGRAIVVEGKEQIREVLSDGEDALFYRGADALAAAITSLVEDPPRRNRLGSAARARFEAHHTLAHRRRELDALLAARLG
jgi:glycosyltransferase involved in cell wall biosynthesis